MRVLNSNISTNSVSLRAEIGHPMASFPKPIAFGVEYTSRWNSAPQVGGGWLSWTFSGSWERLVLGRCLQSPVKADWSTLGTGKGDGPSIVSLHDGRSAYEVYY